MKIRPYTLPLVRGSERSRRVARAIKHVFHRRNESARRALAADVADAASWAIPYPRGYRVFEPGRIEGTAELAQCARERVEELGIDGPGTADKGFLHNCLIADSEIAADSPMMRFALSEAVLAPIIRYLGVVPLLRTVDVWHSVRGKLSEELRTSQLFHCDWVDRSQVKIFVMASDVTEDDGPLVVMGAETSRIARERIGYRYGGLRMRVYDEEMELAVTCRDTEAVTGPPGTTAFVDTSRCFHYGSRIHDSGRSRTLAYFQYLTPLAFNYFRDASSVTPYRHLADASMSPVQRAVLGAELV